MRSGRRVAFEIQVSSLSHPAMLERQARYKEDGVRGCWFYTGVRAWRQPTELPVFELVTGEEPRVRLHGKYFPVQEAVWLLLTGRVKFRRRRTTRPLRTVIFYQINCHRCHRRTDICAVKPPVSPCGIRTWQIGRA